MKKYLCLLLFIFSIHAENFDQKNIVRYLELYKLYPKALGSKGDWKRGEMELIWDLPTMVKMQEKFNQPIGIVAEDRFWIWIRDAIILPSGDRTTYNRFIPRKGLSGPGSVVVLAITPKKEILVNLIYRHATRDWEIELPRGGGDANETAEQAAKREVEEETGYVIESIQHLGKVAADSGIFTNFLDVFFAKIDKSVDIKREKEEVIASVMALPKNQIEDLFCKGQKTFVVKGQKITAYCRDAFFAYALFIADKKGLL